MSTALALGSSFETSAQEAVQKQSDPMNYQCISPIIELTFLFDFQELRGGIRGMPLYFPIQTKYSWLLWCYVTPLHVVRRQIAWWDRKMGFACGKLHTSHCNATSVQRDHFNRLPPQPNLICQIIIWCIVCMWVKTLHFSLLKLYRCTGNAV